MNKLIVLISIIFILQRVVEAGGTIQSVENQRPSQGLKVYQPGSLQLLCAATIAQMPFDQAHTLFLKAHTDVKARIGLTISILLVKKKARTELQQFLGSLCAQKIRTRLDIILFLVNQSDIEKAAKIAFLQDALNIFQAYEQQNPDIAKSAGIHLDVSCIRALLQIMRDDEVINMQNGQILRSLYVPIGVPANADGSHSVFYSRFQKNGQPQYQRVGVTLLPLLTQAIYIQCPILVQMASIFAPSVVSQYTFSLDAFKKEPIGCIINKQFQTRAGNNTHLELACSTLNAEVVRALLDGVDEKQFALLTRAAFDEVQNPTSGEDSVSYQLCLALASATKEATKDPVLRDNIENNCIEILSLLKSKGVSLKECFKARSGKYNVLDMMLRADLCGIYKKLTKWLFDEGVEWTPAIITQTIDQEFSLELNRSLYAETYRNAGSLTCIIELLRQKYKSLIALPKRYNLLKAFLAIRIGDQDYIDWAIESKELHRQSVLSGPKGYIMTVLHYAALFNRVEIFKGLYQAGVNNLLEQSCESIDFTGSFPLHIACMLGHTELITYLLSLHEKGVNIGIQKRNWTGYKAVELLEEAKSEHVIKQFNALGSYASEGEPASDSDDSLEEPSQNVVQTQLSIEGHANEDAHPDSQSVKDEQKNISEPESDVDNDSDYESDHEVSFLAMPQKRKKH